TGEGLEDHCWAALAHAVQVQPVRPHADQLAGRRIIPRVRSLTSSLVDGASDYQYGEDEKNRNRATLQPARGGRGSRKIAANCHFHYLRQLGDRQQSQRASPHVRRRSEDGCDTGLEALRASHPGG